MMGAFRGGKMEFRQLKTFRAVADDQSFTRAAQKLFMAQSSVSAQIKALEQELDVRLFDRIGRRVLITDAGSTLYEYARRMEDMTKEIRSEVSGSSQTRGSLTIRIPETLAAIYMPQIVEDFHGHHPEVKLIFINCSDQKLREELNSGRIDLAFLMTDAVYFKEVNVRLLKTEKLIMVSGPSHPFVGRKRVTYPDLSNQTLLLPKTD
ncbi:MAG: LysR family transcriptional regulator [Desulfobacula sp.]|nr:LysR family transcriptional regulator [Desulfobacula sp.]